MTRLPFISPISSDELEIIRAELPAATAANYLNAGTLGPLPRRTGEVMAEQLRRDVEQRQDPELWPRLTQLQLAARSALTSLTGVGVEQVALMHTTHEAINVCLWGLELDASDSIVTTDEEHMGVLVPLRHVIARCGVELRIAPWVEGDAAFVESMLRHVDASTRAIVVSHVSWVTGRVAPLRELRDALPDGCRLIVDGAQSAGVFKVDPSDGWDAYTVSGQKWPCGPNGSGGLALIDPEAWLPTFGSGMQVEDYTQPLTSPIVADGRRFESSQEAMAPLAGFANSVGWLVEDVGLWRARAHGQALNARARMHFASFIDETALMGAEHLLCVDVGAGTADSIAVALDAQGISIRNLGPDRIRLSFGCWNTPAEIDAAVAAIGEAIAN
ncbi:MAG: cysteine desulfurase [Thermoleophilia bacterium]|nr:cysteine desulfurase [Thermoleophilia bacterium]